MKTLIAMIACTLLFACEAPKTYTTQALDFTKATPIQVNVAEIRLVESYQSSNVAPFKEQEFPIPPAAGVKQWLKQRLKAVGTHGVLEMTIDDASVREVGLQTQAGFIGFITNDQEARYDATLHVTARLYDGTNAISAATGDVIVTRSKTIDEKATVEDRRRLFDDITHDLMQSFDQQMAIRLSKYFSPYLVR